MTNGQIDIWTTFSRPPALNSKNGLCILLYNKEACKYSFDDKYNNKYDIHPITITTKTTQHLSEKLWLHLNQLKLLHLPLQSSPVSSIHHYFRFLAPSFPSFCRYSESKCIFNEHFCIRCCTSRACSFTRSRVGRSWKAMPWCCSLSCADSNAANRKLLRRLEAEISLTEDYRALARACACISASACTHEWRKRV